MRDASARRFGGIHRVERVRQSASGDRAAGEAEHATDEGDANAATQYQRDDTPPLRAERDSKADLRDSLSDVERHHSVDSRGGEKERDRRQRDERRG